MSDFDELMQKYNVLVEENRQLAEFSDAAEEKIEQLEQEKENQAAYIETLEKALAQALEISPVSQVLVEQSVLGWKEIEYEVMRDCEDNVIMITSMENIDPMGVHTGDSIVVAPAQSLTAEEYTNFVNLSRKIIRKVDITGGGANIQFGQNPENGKIVIIEVNPRLFRYFPGKRCDRGLFSHIPRRSFLRNRFFDGFRQCRKFSQIISVIDPLQYHTN